MNSWQKSSEEKLTFKHFLVVIVLEKIDYCFEPNRK